MRNGAGGTEESRARTGRSADLLTDVALFASRDHPRAGMAETLTEAMIAEGMARAKRVACQGNARCFARLDPLEVRAWMKAHDDEVLLRQTFPDEGTD